MPASIGWSGRSCRLFFGSPLSAPLSKEPRRVRLVLVRPPLFRTRRMVRIRILRIPARQRDREYQVVVRPLGATFRRYHPASRHRHSRLQRGLQMAEREEKVQGKETAGFVLLGVS